MLKLRGKRSEYQLQFHRTYEHPHVPQWVPKNIPTSFLPGAETWNRTLTPLIEIQKSCRILHKKPFFTARQDVHFINCTTTQTRTWLFLVPATHTECLTDAQENIVSLYNTDFWECNGYRGRKHWQVLPTPDLREAVGRTHLSLLRFVTFLTLCHWQPHWISNHYSSNLSKMLSSSSKQSKQTFQSRGSRQWTPPLPYAVSLWHAASLLLSAVIDRSSLSWILPHSATGERERQR